MALVSRNYPQPAALPESVPQKPPPAVSSARSLLVSCPRPFARYRELLGSERLRPAIPVRDAARSPHFSAVPENQRPVLLLRSGQPWRNPAHGARRNRQVSPGRIPPARASPRQKILRSLAR